MISQANKLITKTHLDVIKQDVVTSYKPKKHAVLHL